MTRYEVQRWASPDGSETGWLVLDHDTSENGGPTPVDVFPTRAAARQWIGGQPIKEAK